MSSILEQNSYTVYRRGDIPRVITRIQKDIFRWAITQECFIRVKVTIENLSPDEVEEATTRSMGKV